MVSKITQCQTNKTKVEIIWPCPKNTSLYEMWPHTNFIQKAIDLSLKKLGNVSNEHTQIQYSLVQTLEVHHNLWPTL
jgi:hypothetical protein